MGEYAKPPARRGGDDRRRVGQKLTCCMVAQRVALAVLGGLVPLVVDARHVVRRARGLDQVPDPLLRGRQRAARRRRLLKASVDVSGDVGAALAKAVKAHEAPFMEKLEDIYLNLSKDLLGALRRRLPSRAEVRLRRTGTGESPSWARTCRRWPPSDEARGSRSSQGIVFAHTLGGPRGGRRGCESDDGVTTRQRWRPWQGTRDRLGKKFNAGGSIHPPSHAARAVGRSDTRCPADGALEGEVD